MTMMKIATIRKQQGAALVVGLILLVVVTVLAISGMNTATTELAMARNDQNFENAFQAAENGLERALSQPQFDPSVGVTITETLTSNETMTIIFEDDSPVPDKAYSLGSKVSALHFIAEAQAVSSRTPGTPTDRDSKATHSQAFYVVGPQDPTLKAL